MEEQSEGKGKEQRKEGGMRVEWRAEMWRRGGGTLCGAARKGWRDRK